MSGSYINLICKKPVDPNSEFPPLRPASGMSRSTQMGCASQQSFPAAAQATTAKPSVVALQCEEMPPPSLANMSGAQFGDTLAQQARASSAIDSGKKASTSGAKIDWASETRGLLSEFIARAKMGHGASVSVAYRGQHLLMSFAWYTVPALPGNPWLHIEGRNAAKLHSIDFAFLVQKIRGGQDKDIVVSLYGHPLFKDGQMPEQSAPVLLAQRSPGDSLDVLVRDALNKISDVFGRQRPLVTALAKASAADIKEQVAGLLGRESGTIDEVPVLQPKPKTVAQILMGL